MLSTPLAAALARRDIHYAWVVVAVTFLSMLVSAGAVGAPGVLLLPLQREFGWDTADISTAMAIRLLLFGLMGPFAAAMINRFGVRRMVLSSLTLVGGGLLASLAMREVWQLILLWGFVVGFGTGLTAMVLGATIATRWFVARRGLVIGLLTASSATGQLVFMPLLSMLTEAYGWRSAIALLCGLIAVAALAMLALMRDHPANLGLSAFGEVEGAPPAVPAGAILAAALGALRNAAVTRTFWVLFATFFICGASTNGLIQTHLIPLCVDFSVPEVQAAGLLALMGIFDFVGTVGSGWLSDRYDNRWLLVWYYGLRGLSLLYLPYSDFTLYGLSVFAVFYGLDWIATVPPTVRLTAERFGRERANLVFGWIFAGHQLGAAAAAFGAGLSRSTLQTYLPAFATAGALCLFAAVLVPMIGGRAKPVAAE
ncbi:MFS family permease [Azospirillum lipoferum]|uniref:MFS transporter n=1 Tax=Azospirillum lipoferum TaxID=193 RepID=A0A5A9GAZ2_AZOLI|nr:MULTISPECIES: MFS transporter [Azospirillum]KAA0590439.1 MFS transporter [Azospirillum lipoferum]MCP1613325.1 MFS family permease [Azospirillum lipoferum]MDW5533236.1 MFS transporter [Azospirillum sp. NL1]